MALSHPKLKRGVTVAINAASLLQKLRISLVRYFKLHDTRCFGTFHYYIDVLLSISSRVPLLVLEPYTPFSVEYVIHW